MDIKQILTSYNRTVSNRDADDIKYLVIHFVGATGGAEANAKYFAGKYIGSSAHYFVGHAGEIVQSVLEKDIAWHCGASTYKHPSCRNSNSIGIELCVRKNATGAWYFEQVTVDAAIALTKLVMGKYDIPVENVIRHYDVTGKNCPAPFVADNLAWNNFKSKLSPAIVPTITNDSNVAYYTVVAGDTLYGISRKLNITVQTLMSINGLTSTTIAIGQKLITQEISTTPVVTPTPIPVVAAPISRPHSLGEHIIYSSCYNSSTSTTPIFSSGDGIITRVLTTNVPQPYLIDNGKCWVNDGDIRGLYVAPAPVKPSYVILVVDGDFGPATIKRLQQVLGVTMDGVFGPVTIKALQRKLNVVVDGDFGPTTKKALQRKLGVTTDGVIGSTTIKALQTALNNNTF